MECIQGQLQIYWRPAHFLISAQIAFQISPLCLKREKLDGTTSLDLCQGKEKFANSLSKVGLPISRRDGHEPPV